MMSDVGVKFLVSFGNQHGAEELKPPPLFFFFFTFTASQFLGS